VSKRLINLIIISVFVLFISGILIAFSIFTNSSGYYRMYLSTDIPFVYHLHNSTPAEYFAPIEAGAEAWNNVRSAYWEFEIGNTVSNSSVAQDGVNLVFFDTAGVNFPPSTQIIAFSSTFTSGTGSNFHAVESDLVWNARDYPPNPTDKPGGIDLQGTVAHEFGHHLGLGHLGPVGGPPGVGETIPEATMYGFASPGDTTARSLHIHDKAGVTSIYPGWILEGTITDALTGNPIQGPALITCVDTFTVDLGGVEEPSSGAYQIPGYLADSYVTDNSGSYSIISLLQSYELTVSRFGYPPQTFPIDFDSIRTTPTQILDGNFELVPYASATISGNVFNTATSAPAENVSIDLFGINKDFDNLELIKSTMVDVNGDYSFTVPSVEGYKVSVSPQFPYYSQSKVIESLPGEGVVMDFQTGVSDVLIVNDHPKKDYNEYFTDALDSLGITYHIWKTFEKAILPPPVRSIPSLFNYNIMIWLTGEATTSSLLSVGNTNARDSLAIFLSRGGNLFLTGQNVAEKLQSTNFLSDFLNVSYEGNSTSLLASPVSGNPITPGMGVLLFNGTESAGNQVSIDILSPLGLANPAFNLIPSGGTAMVTIEDTLIGYKIVFSSIGLEGIRYHSTQRDLLRNILSWFDLGIIVGIQHLNNALPVTFKLEQNYPNPFNPETNIRFSVPAELNGERATLKIFDILGREVVTLFDETVHTGVYNLRWDGIDENGQKTASGIYFYRIVTKDHVQIRKMILMK
jgi:hypothetical protein